MNLRNISTESLTNGEQISLGCIEITTIPHSSIISDTETQETIVERYKIEFASLLNEVFQTYKSISISRGYSADISVELLWKTTPVQDQPYNANIRLFIIVRAISSQKESSERDVSTVIRLFESTLTLQKYEYTDVEYSTLHQMICTIDSKNICAIVKEEATENLQNQLLPFCYSYDRFPITSNDLSRIVNVLIDYPDCAVSMQLIPTTFENNEIAEVDRITQALDTLSRGVMDQGIGNVSFALAQKHADVYRYYSENKTSALFVFNILVYGNDQAVSNISSRLFGQLSSGNAGTISLSNVRMNRGEVDTKSNFYPLPWAVNEILIGKDRNYTTLKRFSLSSAFAS